MFNRENLLAKSALVLLLGVVGYYLYAMLPLLHNNLWNDEVYTLLKFTLVPLHTTVTDYHVPNNHVLYNIFNHFYLRAFGISTMRQALEQAWVLRLPLLLLSLGMFAMLYRTGKMLGSTLAGLLTVALVATNIPVQNFALQVRGYSFTMFFDAVLVCASLHYFFHRNTRQLAVLLLAAWAAVYSIPSNLYCVMGLLAFWGVEWLLVTIKERTFDKKNFKPIVALLLGVALALLCYVPVFKDVFTNGYVRSGNASTTTAQHLKAMFDIYKEIIVGKEVLYVLLALSLIAWIAMRKRLADNKSSTLWNPILWQLATPIVMVCLRGETPPDRIFIYLAPLIALLVGVTIAQAVMLAKDARLQAAAAMLIVGYVVVCGVLERQQVYKALDENIRMEFRNQDLQANYYQHRFEPLNIIKALQQNSAAIPIVLHSSEPHDMPDYLDAFKISYHIEPENGKGDTMTYYLATRKPFYMVTLFPHVLDSTYKAQNQITVQEIVPPGYHHLYRLSPR